MNPKEIKISVTSDVIQVSADELWKIVGPGFGDVGAWTSSVDRSSSIGKPQFSDAPCDMRTCHVNISGYSKVSEKLTHYDEFHRQLAYQVTEGVPGFVLLASNHWTIRGVGGNQSVAELNCTLRLTPWLGMLMGGMMKRQILKELATVLQELKTYAETGEVSAKKKKRRNALDRAQAA